ncbi:hypothetical protein QFZ84_004826 [Pseudomonas fluorescens]
MIGTLLVLGFKESSSVRLSARSGINRISCLARQGPPLSEYRLEAIVTQREIAAVRLVWNLH